MTFFPYLALLASAAAWGGLFHVGTFIVSVIDPFWFAALRYFCAALLSAPFMFQPVKQAEMLRDRGWVAPMVLGLLGYGFFPVLVFLGLQQSEPSHGAVIMATMPITVQMFNSLIHRQLPPRASWIAIGCAMWGVCLIAGIWTGASASGASTWKGDLMAWVGTLGWIAYTQGACHLRHLTPLRYTGWTNILAIPGLLVIAGIATVSGYATLPAGPQLIQIAPAMLYTVIVATVGAAWAYNFGIRRLGSAQGIVFVNFIPITATLISVVEGKHPSLSELTGMTLVIVALLFHARTTALPSGKLAVPRNSQA